MDQGHSDFLAIDLGSVHVMNAQLSVGNFLKVHVAEAARQVTDSIHGQLDRLDLAVIGEDLAQVFLGHVACQLTHMYLSNGMKKERSIFLYS